jgi:hypothetical protein
VRDGKELVKGEPLERTEKFYRDAMDFEQCCKSRFASMINELIFYLFE